ncbi:CBO0543 family protein [Alkalihalobacterium elongatum]|uniref:CBO0543 family protein n=1 Tax=Alkalihalobacterium elongatum TaxID=2675466 RepID=UPI001C1F4AD7|nr:CBO0543 family protein [Alkalihalobacterium elongatum]
MVKHTLERSISVSSTLISIILLFVFVPKSKIRQALVSFLFHQVITWFFGLLVVEKGLVTYPYRLYFQKSNKSSFIFEYLIFPTLAVFFNLYFPKKRNLWLKIAHYLFFTSIITFFETVAVKYTHLIKYRKWTWYWSFITIWLSYYISHVFYSWYFQNRKVLTTNKQNFTDIPNAYNQ